jgi:hypothetical protein
LAYALTLQAKHGGAAVFRCLLGAELERQAARCRRAAARPFVVAVSGTSRGLIVGDRCGDAIADWSRVFALLLELTIVLGI